MLASTSRLSGYTLAYLKEKMTVIEILVFLRWPEPGQTKTRLIPGLGAAAAARFQAWMSDRVVASVQQWQSLNPAQHHVTLWFSGGTLAQFEAWLGPSRPGWRYAPQGKGDLGDRMGAAFQSALGQGAERAVLIGTDCPDLALETLQQAVAALDEHNLVLGPTFDGGYYLIGLQRWCPGFLQGITWSTDTVRAATLAQAEALGLSATQLSPLQDLDYPEDIRRWCQDLGGSSRDASPRLSVIIPVRNEAENLAQTLPTLWVEGEDLEVIVVDGGSTDLTVNVASTFGVQVVQSSPSRAIQMNAGAARARGKRLLFLHGDTLVPPGFQRQMEQVLQQPDVVAGAFELAIAGRDWRLRGVEWGVRLRSHWLQVPYGDQGLFLDRDCFDALGGFAELPIMEDFELVQRLRRRGTVAIAPSAVTTSARRWQALGILKTTAINQLMLLGYHSGIAPDRLAAWYRQQKDISSKSLE